MPSKDDALSLLSKLSELPFIGQKNVPDFINCDPDILKTECLKQSDFQVTASLCFKDRLLPETDCIFREHKVFPMSHFVDLHNAVKSHGVHNYRGARIPLAHNNINVGNFRSYLTKYKYPHLHILQFCEFGFPLGLWSDAFLKPCDKNHSSAYSYHTHVDKFVETELVKLGVTGPFESSPFENVMLSPMMTSPKKPSSRRTVFDASFGLYSLNMNTPEKAYHDQEYEFQFPTIDNYADIIAQLGPGCFMWKRDLSRFFLQLKIDPFEYDRLGFVWRSKLFLFVSFVWGCRHAGYAGQWLTTAVAFIVAQIGLEQTGVLFQILNYADDFAGVELCKDRAQLSFATLGDLLTDIGLAESKSKACAPATTMTYLGVSFDTVNMCICVDSEKLVEIKAELQKWSRKTVAKKFELQSILGKLLWVSRAVRFSRIFVARIIAEVRKLKKQSDKTTLSREIRKDFLWWENFIDVFSGVEIIPAPTASLAVYGDACVQGGGSWYPAVGEYFSMLFPDYMCSPDTPIHIKEFVIVILCVRLWGEQWSGQRIVIYCDNDSVCDTCCYQKPKDLKMQQLLREFLYWVCKYNFFPIVHKIGTKENCHADYISRVYDQANTDKYFESCGYKNQSKVKIPLSWFSFKAEW